MRRLAGVSVFVDADTELRAWPFVSSSGARVALLELGDGGEVGVSGSPAAMRRLAAAVLAAAAAAEELPDKRPAGDAALRVVAGP
jgi:hypothetical protein